MPNIKSSIKRVRSSEAKAQANKSRRSELKTLVKNAIVAKEEGRADAEDVVRKAQSALDRAVTDGIISRNTAANRKARIARVRPTDA
ncbi:MAG: 30S ribosomal protein S20 [Saccharofermentanales bacterium]